MNCSKWLSGIVYLLCILLGNYFVIKFGIIDLAIIESNTKETLVSLTTPAGAVFVGLCFSARDFAQRFWGHIKIWYWMFIAAIVTLFFNIDLAIASLAAFMVAEFSDWLVFTFLKKSFKWRIIVSNTISCPLDSLVFVVIAFGWIPEAIYGQAIVKYISGLLVLPLIPYIEKFYLSLGNNNEK